MDEGMNGIRYRGIRDWLLVLAPAAGMCGGFIAGRWFL